MVACCIMWYNDFKELSLKLLMSNRDKNRGENMSWDDMVEYYLDSQGYITEENIEKKIKEGDFSPQGKTVYVDNEHFRGYYWYYENDDFILDIHYFTVKKDYFMSDYIPVENNVFIFSNYIILGNGEWYRPYKIIEPNSLLVLEVNDVKNHYSLHPGPFCSVGVKFKEKMIEKYIVEKMNLDKEDVLKIFYGVENEIRREISKISSEIMAFKDGGVIADLFFESKAKEWLRITLEGYLEKKESAFVSVEDEAAIKNVAKYIDDHFSYNIKQDFLEELSFMSGTKLKQTFKKYFSMSITEYTQRRRMNMAETFLLTTDLKIGDIAKAVGYNSQSRFTTLYKRYKGLYPKDVRKISKK